MIHLSKDQKLALNKLLKWHKTKKKPQFITLGGYAGTGKTTLLSIFRSKIKKDKKVAFCTFTGKASLVLTEKLKEYKSIQKKDFIGTIHSLIYSPIINDKDEIVGWERKDRINYDLIIIDEASMVNEQIWNDLCSYKIPVIAVGDHGQLPPIHGSFNLMERPDILLEEIHRQAKKNPIIQLSINARTHGNIKYKEYSGYIAKLSKSDTDTKEKLDEIFSSFDRDTLVLCGLNYTRVKLNRYIRSLLGFSQPTPQVGDRVICLRNNHIENIYNGTLGTIESIKSDNEDWYYAEISIDNSERIYTGLIYKKQFDQFTPQNFTTDRRLTLKGDLFDFGYAITVHKAQGSQARRVVLFEERFSRMSYEMWRRWLYTAVTRAQEELFIIGKDM